MNLNLKSVPLSKDVACYVLSNYNVPKKYIRCVKSNIFSRYCIADYGFLRFYVGLFNTDEIGSVISVSFFSCRNGIKSSSQIIDYFKFTVNDGNYCLTPLESECID